jgi:magnesium chelatase subunit I
MSNAFPFSAIVGQEEMKLSLLATAIDPAIGGVLVFGDRGTGKSTAVRAMAELLPPMQQVPGCPYNCDPDTGCPKTVACPGTAGHRPRGKLAPVPVVDLPLGVTEDRVVGALDLERALVHGEKAFEPGLLARANRGYLYIDEVNLLEDHIVDLLLDVAASGENVVEREGLSVRHPARFVLVGSGNPEEGELRPQLLDRFGLSVEVATPTDLKDRIEIIRRREAYEQNRAAYRKRWASREGQVRARIRRARERLDTVAVSDDIMERIAELCVALQTDGLRGELTLVRAARAMAALAGDDALAVSHVREVAPMALRHRLRRDPLDESSSGTRVERAVTEVLG